MIKMIRDELRKYKNCTLFLSIILVGGLLCGIFLTQYLDKSLLEFYSNSAFLSVLIEVDPIEFFYTQFSLNILVCILIVILGFSLVGMPFISFVLFTKGLQIGFSCSIYILSMNIEGILANLIVLLPQVFLDSFAIFVVGIISFKLSYMLVRRSFFSDDVLIWKKIIDMNLNAVLISFSIVLFSSIIKSTVIYQLAIWLSQFDF